MAWELLFKSDIGLASLCVIVFTLGMSIFYARYFAKKINESSQQDQK